MKPRINFYQATPENELVFLRANALEDHPGDDQPLRKLRPKLPLPVA